MPYLIALVAVGVVFAEHNGERPERAVSEVEAVSRREYPLRRDQRAAAEHLSRVLLHDRCLQFGIGHTVSNIYYTVYTVM